MQQINIPFQNQNLTLPQLTEQGSVTKTFQEQKIKNYFINPQKNLEDTLSTLLPDNKEETKLQKARNILGEIAKDQTDQDLQVFLTEMQFLIDSWLDTFEQQVFEGLTLEQILREG